MENVVLMSVLDVFRSPRKDAEMVLVEVSQGQPTIGMEFESEDPRGRWRISGLGSVPAEFSETNPNRFYFLLRAMDGGNHVQIGTHLREWVQKSRDRKVEGAS